MLSISLRLPSNMVISQIEHFKRPPLSTHKNIAGDIRRQACGMSISFDRLVSIIKRDKHQSLVPVIYFVAYFFFICYYRIFQFYLLLSYISVLFVIIVYFSFIVTIVIYFSFAILIRFKVG